MDLGTLRASFRHLLGREDLSPASEDFYAFVNRRWIDSGGVPPTHAEWNTWTAMQERADEQCCRLLDSLPSPGRPTRGATPDELQLAAVWAIAKDEEAIEAAGLEPLTPVLQACDLDDRTAAISALHVFGVHVFFEPVLATDPNDGERLRLRLRPGGLGLPHTDYYLKPEHEGLLAAYEAHVARMLQLLGEANATAAAADAAGVLAIEARLVAARRAPRASRVLLDGVQACCRLCCRCAPGPAGAHQRPYAQRAGLPLASGARRLTPAELEARCGGVAWRRYLRGVGAASLSCVVVDSESCLAATATVLRDAPRAALRSYLRYHVALACAPPAPLNLIPPRPRPVTAPRTLPPPLTLLLRLRCAPLLPRAVRNEHFRFFGTELRGVAMAPPPRARALAATDAALGASLGQLYARRHCPPATRAAAAAVGEAVRAQLLVRLRGAGWLSEDTRQSAVRKAAAMRVCVGAPVAPPPCVAAGAAAEGAGAAGTAGAGAAGADAAGAGAAGAAQAALFASPGTSPPAALPMLTVVLRARAAELARLVEQADTPAEGAAGPAAMARWDGVPPHKVNACYDPQQNALLLPAAMLQPPLCPAANGAAGLFGGLGAVVAHEMTHGFDGTGACACTCACTYA